MPVYNISSGDQKFASINIGNAGAPETWAAFGCYYNLNKVIIGPDAYVEVVPYQIALNAGRTDGGYLEIHAEEIDISGWIDAEGSGYNGEKGGDGGAGRTGTNPPTDGSNGTDASSNINYGINYQIFLGSGGGGGGGGSGNAIYLESNSGGGGGGGAGASGGGVIKLFANKSLIIRSTAKLVCKGNTSHVYNGNDGGGFYTTIDGIYDTTISSNWYNSTTGLGGPLNFAGAGGTGGSAHHQSNTPGTGKGGIGGNLSQDLKHFYIKWPNQSPVQLLIGKGGNGGDGGGGAGGGILLHCYENMVIYDSSKLDCTGSIRKEGSLISSTSNAGPIKVFYGTRLWIDNKPIVTNRQLVNSSYLDTIFINKAKTIIKANLWAENRGKEMISVKGIVNSFSTNNINKLTGKSKVIQSWQSNDDYDLQKYIVTYSQECGVPYWTKVYNVPNYLNTPECEYIFNPECSIGYDIKSVFYSYVYIPQSGDETVYTRQFPHGRLPYYIDIYHDNGVIEQCNNMPLGSPTNISLSYPKNILTPITINWSAPTLTEGLLDYTYFIYKSNGDLYTSGTVSSSTTSTPAIPITLEGAYYCIIRANHKITGCPTQDSIKVDFYVYGYCPTPTGTISYSIVEDDCVETSESKQDYIYVTLSSNTTNCTHMYVYLDGNTVPIYDTMISLPPKTNGYGFKLPILPAHTRHSLTVKLDNVCGGERISSSLTSSAFHFWTKYNLSLPQFTPLIELSTPTLTEGSCVSAFVFPYPNSDVNNFWDSGCRLYVTSTSATTAMYYDDFGSFQTITGSNSWNTTSIPLCVFIPVDTDGGSSITFKAWGTRTCAVSNVKTVTYGIIAYDNPLAEFWAVSGMTTSNNYSNNYNKFAIPNVTAYQDTDGIYNTFLSGYAPNLTITFQESCTPEITPISSYNWDFGDYYMDTFNLSAMELSANSFHTGRIYPRYNRSNYRTYLTDHKVEHTYIVPGYYDITLTVNGSANPSVIPQSSYKQKQTQYKKHYIYVEEINPLPSFEIRMDTTLFNEHKQPSGNSPLTVYSIASSLSAGSFPIHKVIYDWGDGSEITVIDNYSDMLFDPLTTVAIHTYIRNFSLEANTYTISMSAFAEITDTMVTTSLNVGPVNFVSTSANVIDADSVRLIATKLHNVDNKLLLVMEDQLNNRMYNFIASGL